MPIILKDSYKVLIVEDDKMIQEVLAGHISKESMFNVYIANNGQEGLYSALTNTPDLILLDVMMPVMDGVTMFKELRKDQRGKDVPVIFLTSYDTDERVLKEISEEKPAYYLLKSSIKMDEIVDKIKVTLGIKQ